MINGNDYSSYEDLVLYNHNKVLVQAKSFHYCSSQPQGSVLPPNSEVLEAIFKIETLKMWLKNASPSLEFRNRCVLQWLLCFATCICFFSSFKHLCFFLSKCAVKLFTLFSQFTLALSFYVCFYKVRLEWPLRSSLLYSQDPPNYYARAVVQTMFWSFVL